ncbi:hypothetical protein SARC_01074 [Sphaeroforma arctica JP610]|uniref:START domain-containing protein n=1 Tax=Sphaeroforma arctica JP610 TaxID=667725 RepID=A0A0L0GCN7_9EUKA|nr:hypothetical protein SARC_01074 [Sphaeroforma arctica JP610]KNC86780.1 hypothetical protein SARC_01074 [Sphaeroforma arctica JP610]|eukprot:XP_014160682.1 hypothetical protein SARC_01074 [Sphaeroforma arctica JP610]
MNEVKSIRTDTATTENPIQDGAKPRQRLELSKSMTISDVDETRASLKSGFKFKSQTLYTFDLTYKRKRSRRDVVKTEHVHMAADSMAVAQQWVNAIQEAIDRHALSESNETLIEDDVQSVDFPETGENGVEAPPEPSLAVLNSNQRKKATGGIQQSKMRVAFHAGKKLPVLEELENPGTYMARLIMRAHPQAVFEELLLWSVFNEVDDYSVVNMVKEVHILDNTENNRDVVHILFSSTKLMSPRELVIERLWRLEDNGTYVMTFNSVEHGAVPIQTPAWMDWTTPIRMQAQGGWTIAPLLESGSPANEIQESMVTLACRSELSGTAQSVSDYASAIYSINDKLVYPLFSNLLTIKRSVQFSRFVGGTVGVMDRLANQQAERRAEEHGKRALQMGTSLKVIMAVAKFKKALNKTGQKRVAAVVIPSNVPRSMWYDPGAVTFQVRGQDYFNDGVKQQTQSPVFQLVALDLFKCKDVINEHLAGDPGHILQTEEAQNGPFTVVFNLMIPASPNLNVVLYYRCSDFKALEGTDPFALCWKQFIEGDPNERNSRFKMIPKIVEGSWLIKQAVGTTPVIMGKKLRTAYYVGKNYLEIDIDISNSKVAQKVTGMCLPATKSLTIDMAFLLESHKHEELPERLLGTVRLKKIDLSSAQPLPRDLEKKTM